MKRSESILELAKALAEFQAKSHRINPQHFADAGKAKYDYAELADIVDEIRSLLTETGLVVVQSPRFEDGVVYVETTIIHKKSEEWSSGEVGIPVSPNADARAHGSAITYARRYGLCSMLGVVVAKDDDDGDRASKGRDPDGAMNAWTRSQRAIARAAEELAACKSVEACLAWAEENKDGISSLDPDTISKIRSMLANRRDELRPAPVKDATAAAAAPKSVPTHKAASLPTPVKAPAPLPTAAHVQKPTVVPPPAKPAKVEVKEPEITPPQDSGDWPWEG